VVKTLADCQQQNKPAGSPEGGHTLASHTLWRSHLELVTPYGGQTLLSPAVSRVLGATVGSIQQLSSAMPGTPQQDPPHDMRPPSTIGPGTM